MTAHRPDDPTDDHPVPLSADEEAFMRSFARASAVVTRSFDADLVREEGLALTDYFTLMHLSEAEGRTLRMGDLATAANLSLSGMTRVVQRLERSGWVERRRATDDGRGATAVLTDAGLERLREAWPAHLASVRRHLFEQLDGFDLQQLVRALDRIAPDPRA
ncbi:MarR family winged helix-turn-helix transcriptional regulator [Nocardioides sp. CPCC 205120]|uniref:MarR family winged helix-turn-helix transcriptional regulator n=1 Tax=Nocardioides sp. CPCC 205120 TaxID=3406462 RepID=UPI003B506630